MAVKTLDNHIKKAFVDLGFTEEEVKNGCWLLERNEKPIAWIALHKFLEKVANKAGINFNMPTIINCADNEVAVCVEGEDKDGNKAWSIGEASPRNCKNDYRWAMAEKRAKDRVILKLLGIAGDMYSEEEADEFKEKKPERTEFEKDASKEKAQHTRIMNKAGAAQDESLVKPVEQKKPLAERIVNAKKFLDEQTTETIAKVKRSTIDSMRALIAELKEKDFLSDADILEAKFNALIGLDDNINY